MPPTLREAFARCLLPAALLAAAVPGKAAPVKAQHLEAELVAEPATVEPGRSFTAGLRLKLEPHWHVYWKNPGDAGLPVSIEWSLPKGWSAGPIQWPTPERIAVAPLMNYGYEGEVVFPIELTPPSDAAPSTDFELKAKGKWVVCKEICLPGSADLVLNLPIAAAGKTPRTGKGPETNPAAAELFRRARADLPVPASRIPWKFSAVAGDSLITLVAVPPAGAKTHPDFLFFPEEQEVIENAAPQSFYRTQEGYALDLARLPPDPEEPAEGSDSLIGLVVSPGGWLAEGDFRAVEVRLPLARGSRPGAVGPAVALGTIAPEGHPPAAAAFQDGMEAGGIAGVAPPAAAAAPAGFGKLLFMLSFAFLGGLILNLMPCVLPVLSLKIFDFVKRSGESRLKVFSHGLVFTAGVLVSFWLLATLLLVLRQGGSELGWGFQLQSPSFLMVLCALFFFFSLNLFGVFELGYLFTRIGSGQDTEGHMGSFVAGVTATVVATPCTAPFMGSAMGYAFSQPPQYALLVFTFLGLGMASPYLLLAGFPGLMRFLPKPGEWMEHLKQFMGFPLLGTAIWLAWVLGKQAGVDALVALLFVLLLAGLSAWILGKWTALHRTTPVRVIAGILALVIFVPAFILVLMFVDQQRGVTGSRAPAGSMAGAPAARGEIPWEEFSAARLDGLLAQGSPVFIDFTADWCLSCKVNERVALARPEVANRFRELGLTALKADWTLRDEAIARALAKYGRNSIPLYVLYTGNGDEHVILPEIITPAMVLDALKKVVIPATTLR